MKRKSIIAIIIGIAVIIGCVFFVVTKQKSNTAKVEHAKGGNTGLVIKKKSKNSGVKVSHTTSNSSEGQYSTDEWMLMGYMAYAHDNYVQSRHIKNTSDLVTDVGEDLSDGSLKAENNGNNAYRLTNKFGSVDVTVENDDVKVTGDGSTYTSKSELKDTFGSYAGQIKKMTQTITKGDDNESQSSDSSKQSSSKTNNSPSQGKLNDTELIIAAYLNGFGASTTQGKINLAKEILAKDNVPAKQVPTDDFINGIYKNGNYYSIASNLSTSHYAAFNLNGNSDTITERYGGGGVLNTRHLSKPTIIKRWTPYKDDIDQITTAIENNKKRCTEIAKAIGRQ